MADDDDDYGFPDDFGTGGEEEAAEGAAEAEEPVAMDEDEGCVAADEQPQEDTFEAEETVAEEEVVVEEEEEQVAVPETTGADPVEVVIEDGDDDDDDLEAAELAALAALDGPGDSSEGAVDSTTVATPPASRPWGAAPTKPSIPKQPENPPWARTPTAPAGGTPWRGPAAKGDKQPGKGKGKGFTPGMQGGKNIGKGPVAQVGKSIGKSAGLPIGKSAGKSKDGGKGTPRPPSVAPPAASNTEGKSGGKAAPKDGGIGRRILTLNKAGYWATGQGISVQALGKLRELPVLEATKILNDLEAKASSEPKPSKFILSAIEKKSSAATTSADAPPWRSNSSSSTGVKENKRPAGSPGSLEPPAKRGVAVTAPGVKALIEKLDAQVRTSFDALQTRLTAVTMGKDIVQALLAAELRDAKIILQASVKRLEAGKNDASWDPTKFIVGSLASRKAAAPASNGAAKASIAKAPIGKAPVAKAPVAKAPVAKAPVVAARGVASKVVPNGPVPGRGKPPVEREGLDFEQMIVQEKLKTMNKSGTWKGPHALDEGVLATLMKITPGRAMEILEEIEDQGAALTNPSDFALEKVREQAE